MEICKGQKGLVKKGWVKIKDLHGDGRKYYCIQLKTKYKDSPLKGQHIGLIQQCCIICGKEIYPIPNKPKKK